MRGSSFSEASHSSVIFFVTQHTEGTYGAMQELMKRQKSLMMKNHSIICQEFLHSNVINRSHSPEGI